MESLVFYMLSIVAVTTAVSVVAMRRAVYSALSLIVCLGAVAGLFFQLGAHFIAAIQVIVYAGAIMVLFLFVIMLLDPESEVFSPNRLTKVSLLALPLASFLALLLVWAFPSSITTQTQPQQPPGTEAIARLLFSDYLLPFEATSILILVAVIGAVILTRQSDQA